MDENFYSYTRRRISNLERFRSHGLWKRDVRFTFRRRYSISTWGGVPIVVFLVPCSPIPRPSVRFDVGISTAPTKRFDQRRKFMRTAPGAVDKR